MPFSLHQRGVVMSSQITQTIINIYPLAHVLDICALIFSSCAFLSLSQQHHVTASHPSPGDNHRSTGAVWKNTGPSKNGSVKLIQYICTRALHSFRSFAHWRAASTTIPLLSKATFTKYIQLSLGVPRTLLPLTSVIKTLLAIPYSSIVSTCPNYLNTLRSALFANSLSITSHIRTSSFLTISIRNTPTIIYNNNPT